LRSKTAATRTRNPSTSSSFPDNGASFDNADAFSTRTTNVSPPRTPNRAAKTSFTAHSAVATSRRIPSGAKAQNRESTPNTCT
jgi:hypothetical protein